MNSFTGSDLKILSDADQFSTHSCSQEWIKAMESSSALLSAKYDTISSPPPRGSGLCRHGGHRKRTSVAAASACFFAPFPSFSHSGMVCYQLHHQAGRRTGSPTTNCTAQPGGPSAQECVCFSLATVPHGLSKGTNRPGRAFLSHRRDKYKHQGRVESRAASP